MDKKPGRDDFESFDPRERLLKGISHPNFEPEFRATESSFNEDVNPWACPRFASHFNPEKDHTWWLTQKRDACKKDLDELKKLLEKVTSTAYEERKDAFKSVLRQASGALAELRHIDELLVALNPSHQRAQLDAAFVARIPQTKLKKSYYLGAFHHAA